MVAEPGAVLYLATFVFVIVTAMKFYYVYVLYNLGINYIYIGYTEDLKKRFSFHNSNSARATKPYQPLELIHYEAYRNMTDAKRREKYLKGNKGRTTLTTMLKKYFEGL